MTAAIRPIELLPRPWNAAAPVLALRAARLCPAIGPRGSPRVTSPPSSPSSPSLPGRPDGLSEWTLAEIDSRRQELLAAPRIPAPGSLSAVEIVEAVLAEAPASATVTVDAGAHMFAATWFWRSTRPRRFLISNSAADEATDTFVALALTSPIRERTARAMVVLRCPV